MWWDDYKDYFYASRPETLTLAYGDISELKRFRYSFPATKNTLSLSSYPFSLVAFSGDTAEISFGFSFISIK